MKLSETIYKKRTEARLTQEALAEKLNVSRQSVSKWETGSATPDLERLIAMAELFNMSLDELTGVSTGSEDSERKKPVFSVKKTGAVLAILGAAMAAVILALKVFMPSIAQMTDASSVFTLRGTGFLIIFGILMMLLGLFLYLKRE